MRILSGIANQAAIAIENARLQAQESRTAPVWAASWSWHAPFSAACCREPRRLCPATRSLIGGSARRSAGTLSTLSRCAGKLGMVIADVSDKGIPAALYMVFARTLLRAVTFSVRSRQPR